MSLSPIGSAVFELLSHKHTYRHTDILLLYSKDCNEDINKYMLPFLFARLRSAPWSARHDNEDTCPKPAAI